MATTPLKKLLDNSLQVAEITRSQAEGVVQSLIKAGEVTRKESEAAIEQLIARGKETTAQFVALVQKEVARQVGTLSQRFDQLEDQFEDLAAKLATAARQSPVRRRTSGTSARSTTASAATHRGEEGSGGEDSG